MKSLATSAIVVSSYIKQKGSKATLTIPTDNGEDYVFEIEGYSVSALENENVLLTNVHVTISDDKTKTSVVNSKESEPGTIYALLRVAHCVPDDVFINKKHSSCFELIKKISYTTCEPDYGDYKANVYFVKITLKPDEFVHIYFASKNAYFLKHHIAFYCDDDMEITFKDNLQTLVPNDTEFLSLSELG